MDEAVVSFAIETIAGLLIEEAKFLVGVKDQVEQLQSELRRMKWFLRDADARQGDKDRIREWVSDVKAIAYQAEDLLESYAFRAGSRRGGGLMKALNRCVCILNECYLSHQVGSEIESLNSKILNLKESFLKFGIRDIMEKEGSSSKQQELRRTYSFIDEEDFVGLESDVDMLVQHLVNEDDEHSYYRVVSISGMGGLGKTTIAGKVYNHPNVKRHFDSFAWIYVSQQWQKKDLLVRMLHELVHQRRKEIEKWTEDELKKELYNVQRQRKCLIVLDDIWEKDAWDCIKQGFPTRQKGSKILLTTRNKEVALHIDPNGLHHQPRLLYENEGWELLQRKAPRERYIKEHADVNQMEQLGKKMVEQCGGLPLAVVVLGGILATKHTLSEWEAVHQNIKAILGKGESIGQHQGGVQKILALSYNDLPYQLKPCFLYLGYFSEDTDIKAETLYQMWIAEGMVLMEDRLGEEESMMDVAERYLRALAERGMVKIKTAEMPSVRKFESCRLHDLMRDLCLHLAEEESFLRVINYSSKGEDQDVNDPSDRVTPRLVINLDGKDVCRYVPLRKEMAKRLRMLRFVVSEQYEGRMAETIKSQFKSFKILRVLSIEGLKPQILTLKGGVFGLFNELELLEALGELIHLRYLSLKDSPFHTLPSSLGKLKHLQTLDLQATNIRNVPDILRKMDGLRYLYLPGFRRSRREKVRMVRIAAGEFSKLEILENFDDRLFRATDLQYLTKLRVLTVTNCYDLENLAVIADYISSSNGRLQHVSIEAYCDFASTSELAGLTVLKQLLFGRNIHRLILFSGGISKLPEWEASCDISSAASPSLVELDLWLGECAEDPMRILEKLPHLRKLKIQEFRGKEMTCHATGFPQLRDLFILNGTDLEKWVVERGAMPNLSILRLALMPMIPDGLQFITTLKELYLEGMPNECTERIRTSDGQEGEDFYKIRHVPVLVIRSYSHKPQRPFKQVKPRKRERERQRWIHLLPGSG